MISLRLPRMEFLSVDERAINTKTVLNQWERNENHTICLNSAKAIGCTVVNIGTQNFIEGRVVCTEGPERIRELIAMGASFDHGEDGNLHLTREGGHSHRRIVHAADMTGREIERALLEAVRNDMNISVFEHFCNKFADLSGSLRSRSRGLYLSLYKAPQCVIHPKTCVS
ncbi:hypothetical protein ACS0TY_019896 [Phlomoides rotata]